MSQKTDKYTTLAGLLLIAGIVVFGNIVAARLGLRLDITKEKLYTLSEGTRNILGGLKEPVNFRLYFSESLEEMSPQLRSYHRQVRDLLSEYAKVSDRVNLELIDPQPDTDEEEQAKKDGLAGQPVAPGTNLYLGIVVSSATSKDKEVIAFLSPQRERFLEYDLTRAVYKLQQGRRMKVGILSSLKVMGGEAPPEMMMQQQRPPESEPWMFTQEISRLYDVKKIEPTAGKIDEDVDLLVIMHAKELPEPMLYAIDQFVMRGKNLLIFQDPFYMNDQAENRFGAPAPDSSMKKLLDVWGIEAPQDKVVLDPLLAMNTGVEKHPAVLGIGAPSMNHDDAVTAQLSQLVMLFPGQVGLKADAKEVKFTPLISSSNRAKSVEKFKVMYAKPGELMRECKDVGKAIPLAGMFEGKFKTAYPTPPASAAAQGHLAESKGGVVMIVGDMDMLEDRYCMQAIRIMGQTLGYQPLNQNVVLFANLVEKLSGNRDLISLRSRGQFSRPFEKVLDIENRAREKWQAQADELQKKLQELERTINERLQKVDPNQQAILSATVQEEVRKFELQKRDIAKQLREVNKNLRADIESLGSSLKAVNLLLMPVLIGIFGLLFAIFKSRRHA